MFIFTDNLFEWMNNFEWYENVNVKCWWCLMVDVSDVCIAFIKHLILSNQNEKYENYLCRHQVILKLQKLILLGAP